jgi:hypothetical protein
MRFDGWSKPTTALRFTLEPSEVLRAPIKDAKLSEAFYERTRQYARDKRWFGATAYYPWVSRDDPEYDVYVVRDGSIGVIWVYKVADCSVTDYANFYYDPYRRNIPTVAQRNLNNPTLWYRVEKIKTVTPEK